MAAPTSFPSWAYNSLGNTVQPPVIVQSLTAFNALLGPGTWSATPTGTSLPNNVPADTGLTVTDIRLQQLLIEACIQSQYFQTLLNSSDDAVTLMRPDILANDSSLTS